MNKQGTQSILHQSENSPPLWENPELAMLTGGPLRPGGVALTFSALAKLNLHSKTHILDAGCGNGTTAHAIQKQYQCHVTGLDASFTQAMQASTVLPNVLQSTAHKLPFKNAAFDIIVCECVLSLTPSLVQTCQEFARVLKPSGFLVLSDLYQKDPIVHSRTMQHAPTSSHPSRMGHFDPTPHPQGCACNARPLNEITNGLSDSAFQISVVSDQTKALKELTAQLVFAGIISTRKNAPKASSADTSSECCSTPPSYPLGYYQLIAQTFPYEQANRLHPAPDNTERPYVER